jgi:hypothetical protein
MTCSDERSRIGVIALVAPARLLAYDTDLAWFVNSLLFVLVVCTRVCSLSLCLC